MEKIIGTVPGKCRKKREKARLTLNNNPEISWHMKKSRRTYNGVHLNKKSNTQDVVEQSLTIEEKQKRYEKPLVSILFLLQIFGFYILILYSSYFDRTNKVNRVIAVENIPDRKKVRSYFCDKVLKPLVLLLSVFLWGFLFFLWLR